VEETGTVLLLFFLGRGYHHRHPLALQYRHILGTAEFFQFHSEPEELLLALILEHNGASAEEYRRLDLGSFLKELLSMLEFELEVVLVGVGPETDFLYDHLGSVGLHLLGLLALLIKVLLIVQNLADRGIGLGADLHKVEFKLIGHLQGSGDGIHSRLKDILTNQSDLLGRYLLVDVEFVLVMLLSLTGIRLARTRLEARRLRFVRYSDSKVLLLF